MPLVASFRNRATLRGIEYISLVAAVLAYVLLYPFFVGGGLDLAVFTVLISIVLIAAMYAVAKDRKVVLVCLAMLLPSLLLMGLNFAYQEDTIAIIARALWFTLLAFVASSFCGTSSRPNHPCLRSYCGAPSPCISCSE
jgi:hypothetical protein